VNISTSNANALLKYGYYVFRENFGKNIGDIFFVRYISGINWELDNYPNRIGADVYSVLKVRIVTIQKPEKPYELEGADYTVLQLLEKEK